MSTEERKGMDLGLKAAFEDKLPTLAPKRPLPAGALASAPASGGGEATAASTTDRNPAPARPRASAAADESLTVRRTLFVTEALAEDVALRCAADRITRTVLVLAALNATHTRLGDLIEAEAAAAREAASGSLFAVSVERKMPNSAQIPIRPTVAQLEVIDSLVVSSGARDRSHMISVALRAYLDADGASSAPRD